jgi:acyl-CoA synthetase (NDP forming)
VPLLDKETRAALDIHLPSYATSQNPVDSTAQGVQKLGYAQFARLVAGSPSVDSVVVVITARRSAFLEADLPKLKELARESGKPVFMWTYTLPSERTIEILNETGYPLFVGAHGYGRASVGHPDAGAAGRRADADAVSIWQSIAARQEAGSEIEHLVDIASFNQSVMCARSER